MTASTETEVTALTTMQSTSGKDYAETISHDITPPRTPTTTPSRAHKLFAEIQAIHTTLSSLSDLKPSPQVNDLLTRLVHLCIAPYPSAFTTSFFALPGTSSLCASLRPLCSTAESALETHWAQRILGEARSCTPST
jgi:nicotianamine synthase